MLAHSIHFKRLVCVLVELDYGLLLELILV